MKCAFCNEPIVGRRKGAKYCKDNCKQNNNRDLASLAAYKISTHGRATLMYHNTKARKLDHDLTVEWIKEKLDTGHCEVTGLPFEFTYGSGMVPFAPSLDRIDSTKGYTKDNVRMVVWIYNAAKNVFTDEDVMTMAQALVDNKDGSMKSQRSRSGK